MSHVSPAFRRRFGALQESLAETYLRGHGLRPVARNYHCRQGEIDLVMTHGNQLVFVEVRFRRNTRHGDAVESVTPAKQRRVVQCARHYLRRHGLTEQISCRFDVLGISLNSAGETCYRWIPDAFGVAYD